MKLIANTLTILLAILLIVALEARADTNDPDNDEHIRNLSSFLIDLITKYDETGAGEISKAKYPLFLKEVFLQGSNIPQDQYPHTQLLIQAGTEFTKLKETEGKSVGVQQFYDDIINKFTVFLMGEEQYEPLIETLYADIKQEQGEGKEQQEQQEQEEEEQGADEQVQL